MPARTTFRQRAVLRNLAARGNTLVVRWTESSGGTLDPATEAMVGATNTILSGQIKAHIRSSEPKNVERKFAEVQAGDLVCDIAPDGLVDIYPGQIITGQVGLEVIRDKGVEFFWQDRCYKQKEVGSRLNEIWSTVIGDAPIDKTILLTRKT